MNNNRIFRAMGAVEDDFLVECEKDTGRKTKIRKWIKWSAAAACLCLAVIFASVINPPENTADPTDVTPTAGGSNMQIARIATHYTIGGIEYWECFDQSGYISELQSGYEYAAQLEGERKGAVYANPNEPWRVYIRYSDFADSYSLFTVRELIYTYASYNGHLYVCAGYLPGYAEPLRYLPQCYTALYEGLPALPKSFYAKESFGFWKTERPEGYEKVGTLIFEEAAAYPVTEYGTNEKQFDGLELYTGASDETIYVWDGGYFYYAYIKIADQT